MRKPTKKSLNKLALKCWADQVKARAKNKCELCGEPASDSHHVISRHLKLTRLDIRNGIALCKKHHFYCKYWGAHSGGLGFHWFFIANRNSDAMYLLSTLKPLKD